MEIERFNKLVKGHLRNPTPQSENQLACEVYGLVDYVVRKQGHKQNLDIRQDVVIKVMEYVEKYRSSKSSPWSFLWMVASCRLKDYHAREATYHRRIELSLDDDDSDVDYSDNDDSDVDYSDNDDSDVD